MFTYKESERDCKIKTDNTKLKDYFFLMLMKINFVL